MFVIVAAGCEVFSLCCAGLGPRDRGPRRPQGKGEEDGRDGVEASRVPLPTSCPVFPIRTFWPNPINSAGPNQKNVVERKINLSKLTDIYSFIEKFPFLKI